MKWKIFSTCTLILLSINAVLVFYMGKGFETKKLVVSALKYGATPPEFVEIVGPYREEIVAVINASVVLSHEIEIPEHSPIRQWAENILSGSNWRLIFIKTEENQYYRVIIENLYYRFFYPTTIILIPLVLTICAWISYLFFLVKEALPKK